MSERHGRAMRVVGETLLDLAPHEYGHRIGDEPANLDGTPLGWDATRVVMALAEAGLLTKEATVSEASVCWYRNPGGTA